MSVIFLEGDHGTRRPPRITLLHGAPFPPDDVKAYWSMVPDDISIYVEWSAGFSVFFVSRYINFGDCDDPHVVRKQIMAREANKLAIWMHVISELVNGTE